MLMLTHTWFLNQYLKQENYHSESREIFAFNILPDLLPVQGIIPAAKTHCIKRYDKSAAATAWERFIRFHLLLDDFSHYGEINQVGPDKFLINSGGYTYVKGKALIPLLIEMHESQGRQIDLASASYQSHIVIEMAFDMLLCRSAERNLMLGLLCDGLDEMFRIDRDRLSALISSVFAVDAPIARQSLAGIDRVYSRDKIKSIMDEDRRALICLEKFSLAPDFADARLKMAALLAFGINLIADYRDFLDPALAAIAATNFKLP